MGKAESAVEKYLDQRTRDHGGYTRKLVSPGHRGFPDRLLILPGPMLVFVEVKTESGQPSSLQLREIQRLKKYGALATYVFGKGGVDYIFTILREKCSWLTDTKS